MEAILKRELIANKTACRLIAATAFILFTALGAFVRIPLPFTPVPITLQTFFVLLCGAFLGASWAGMAQLGYILLGAAGFPLFVAGSSGMLYLLGPTAGYLWGFFIAALFVGRLIKSAEKSFAWLFLFFCLADSLILACGTFWLKFLFNFSWPKTFSIGFSPFIPGDLLKAFFASLIYFRVESRLKEIF